MSHSVAVSTRSVLIAGMSAAVVGAAVVSPVDVTALSSSRLATTAVGLASVTTPIEVAIKDTYNALEPWAAYGAEWGQYILGLIPGLWWVAPGVDFAYYTAEPLVQAGVYTFADVVGLNFAQIGPDINNGINASINNAINYGLAWLNALVPLPPLPPIPPFPGASVRAAASLPAAAASTDLLGAAVGPEAKSVTTPIEVAIKNTYNAVEPWAEYGMQWADYIAGLIPVVNWFAPAIPLAYYTIEPLVRAGTYSFADLVGFNFAQIGPDIVTGINTSINNAITYALAWANIPVPPLPPLAAATVSAAAAVEAPDAAVAATAVAAAPSITGDAPKADPAPAAVEATDADDTPAADETPAAAEVEAPAAADATAAVGIEASALDAAPVAAPVASGPAEPSAPAATAGDDDSAPQAQRSSRSGRGSR